MARRLRYSPWSTSERTTKMAYIVGYLTKEEADELERRGWELEPPPAELVCDDDYVDEREMNGYRMRMVWVDNSMFDIMNGPDWDKGE